MDKKERKKWEKIEGEEIRRKGTRDEKGKSGKGSRDKKEREK